MHEAENVVARATLNLRTLGVASVVLLAFGAFYEVRMVLKTE